MYENRPGAQEDCFPDICIFRLEMIFTDDFVERGYINYRTELPVSILD